MGGRSGTYQKQLNSLYNEAVEKIKVAAFEIGANCVLGLTVDLDEISGKGKSMFMLTAIGTAVVLDKDRAETKIVSVLSDNPSIVGLDKINMLKEKKELVAKAKDGTLTLDDSVWQFIIRNKVNEVFPYLVKIFPIDSSLQYPDFYERFINYLSSLSEETQLDLLYTHIGIEKNEGIVRKLMDVARELHLFDYPRCMRLLQSDDFQVKKRGVSLATVDKVYYSMQDKKDLENVRDYLKCTFVERGARTTKKQLLSSKPKDVWACECGKINDIGVYCSGCEQDIFGFKMAELKSTFAMTHIDRKIELINECLV